MKNSRLPLLLKRALKRGEILFWRWRYQNRVEKDLCQFIDLLACIVEAGVDLLSGISIVTNTLSEGELKRSAEIFLHHIRLGGRLEALSLWQREIPLPHFAHLVTLIEQSWQTGGGLSRMLRIQTDQLRLRRGEKIERESSTLPFLLLIPLLFFILPSALLLILLPLLINIQSMMTLP